MWSIVQNNALFMLEPSEDYGVVVRVGVCRFEPNNPIGPRTRFCAMGSVGSGRGRRSHGLMRGTDR
jgi:hypothetical protein